MFLDTVVGTRFNGNVFLDVKSTETFQHKFCPLSLPDLSKERKVFQNSKERLMVADGQGPSTNTI